MKQFKIYEIPGVKIGATSRWPQRVTEQGYKEEQCNVLFETDVLKLASSMEQVLQKRHGYPVDTVRYETTYNANHGKVISEKTRELLSNAATKAQLEIASDPIRNTLRSQRLSDARNTLMADKELGQLFREKIRKINAAISADPIRAAQRSQRMSEAQAEIITDPIRSAQKKQRLLETLKAINNDPVRKTRRSQHISEAQAEIENDPIRSAQRKHKVSEAQSLIKADPAKYSARNQKISESKYKSIEIYGVLYQHASEYAELVGLNPTTIRKRARDVKNKNYNYAKVLI